MNRSRLSLDTHRRLRQHGGEPGMAMLLVILLVVMVSAAGLYAARATSMDMRSAGFRRQAAQTQYVTESGLVLAINQFRRFCRTYSAAMTEAAAPANLPTGVTASSLVMPRQYRFLMSDFSSTTSSDTGSARTYGGVEPFGRAGNVTVTGSGGSTSTQFRAGSLGLGIMQPDFSVTASLISQVPQPIAGYDIGGGNNLAPPVVAVEFVSIGRVQSASSGNQSISRSQMQARATALIPCL